MFRRIDESKEAIFQGLVALGRGAKKLEISTERDTFFLKRIDEDRFEVRVVERGTHIWPDVERRKLPVRDRREIMGGRRIKWRREKVRGMSDLPGRRMGLAERRRGEDRRKIRNGSLTSRPFRNLHGTQRRSAGDRREAWPKNLDRRKERRIQNNGRRERRLPRRSNTRRAKNG